MRVFEKEIELLRQGKVKEAAESYAYKTGLSFKEGYSDLKEVYDKYRARVTAYHGKKIKKGEKNK